jgi:hypothetical protein
LQDPSEVRNSSNNLNLFILKLYKISDVIIYIYFVHHRLENFCGIWWIGKEQALIFTSCRESMNEFRDLTPTQEFGQGGSSNGIPY